MAFLIAENGSQPGHRYPLTQPRHILGRHPDCDIVVDVGAVSRHHAQIIRLGDEYFVEDLQSRNGTFINEQLIFGRQRLKQGDRVRVCDVVFRFQGETPSGRILPETLAAARTVLVEEGRDSSISTIMSKLDISTSESGLRYSATPEAKLKALVEITKSLGRSLSVDQVLPQVLRSLFKIFVQADRAFVVLRNAQGELVPRCTQLRREDMHEPLRLSRTILHEAITAKQAILSADAATDQRFETSDSVADFRIRSLMCAPLVNTENEVLGVIQIDTIDQRNRFRQEDLDVLVSVATQAAAAIDNAQLHERLIEQQTLARDLELAREMQKSFLPSRQPTLDEYTFFDYYEPAHHIGGDYYDYIPLSDGRWGIVVGDVVGHGITAALLMSQLSAAVRFSFASERSPGRALEQLNRSLASDKFDGRFITLIVGILDPQCHALTFVNAGHLPPLIRRADGSIETTEFKWSGFPLLIDPDAEYPQQTIQLGAGDSVILFTDGIVELPGESGDLFGLARLEKQLRDSPPYQLGSRILHEIRQFAGDRPAKDDMCLVCFSRSEPGPVDHGTAVGQ